MFIIQAQIVNPTGKYQNRYQGRRGTPDMYHILMFYCLNGLNLYCIWIQSQKFRFPETTESPGYFVTFANNLGDKLTFKILKNDLVIVLHRSVVRSTADANNQNKRVSFKADVQESLKSLDTKPSFLWRR
jgi:hypothetical protein